MASDDKTVYDYGETVPEDDVTAVRMDEITHPASDETVLEGGTAVREGAASIVSLMSFEKGATILDTYRVESSAIESGGMGRVWRVHHTGWNTDLAMKQQRAEYFATEKQKADFIRECEAWINLGLHPNIVSCYYVRELNAIPTIFAEWMDGGSLAEWIEGGKLYEGTEQEQKERILDIAIQFARGLHYAHERKDTNGENKGIIHQDVKPGNLLLTKEGDAKVSDFGLARARALLTVYEGDTEEIPEYTQSDKTFHSASGGYTPAYCSMEQMDGQALTRRTDVYSWAVSMMEMYIGSRPWANGIVAGLNCRKYFDQTRVPMPEAMKELLAQCMEGKESSRPHDFGLIEGQLLAIYKTETSSDYPRPVSRAAEDSADSLNNRALSFLDLGMREETERCWERALKIEPDHIDSIYNQGVFLWRLGNISDTELILRLKSVPPSERRNYLETLVHMERGDAVSAQELIARAEGAASVSIIYDMKTKLQSAFSQTLTKTIEGVRGECLTLTADDKNLIVYSQSNERFSLYDFDTGVLGNSISGQDAETGCALGSGKSPDIFWSCGRDALVRYSIGENSPTDFFANPTDDTSIWSFSLDKNETKAIALLHTKKRVSSYEIPQVIMWDIEKDSIEFASKCSIHGRIFLSPDAEYFAALNLGSFPLVEVWSIRKRAKILELKGHTKTITGLDINEDFTKAITVGLDGTIRLWELNSGVCEKCLSFPDASINDSIRFMSDSSRALVCGNGKGRLMRIVDLSNGRVLCSMGDTAHASAVPMDEALCLNKAGTRFAIAPENEEVQIWSIPESIQRAQWSLCEIANTSARLAQEKAFMANYTLAKRHLSENNFAAALSALGKARSVSGFEYDPRSLALAKEIGQYCQIKGLHAGWQELVYHGHSSPVYFISMSHDERYTISGGTDRQILLWDNVSGEWIWVIGNADCYTAAFCPQDKSIIAQADKSLVRAVMIEESSARGDGRLNAHTLIHERYAISANAFFAQYHPDGKRFVCGVYNTSAHIFKVGTEKPIHSIRVRDIKGLALSQDGTRIFVSYKPGRWDRADIYDFDTGEKIGGFSTHGAGKLCISPDDTLLAIGTEDGEALIYDVLTGKLKARLEIGGKSKHSVCFNKDGHFLFTRGKGSEILLWDIAEAKVAKVLTGHLKPVISLKLSEDNSFLLSAGYDNTIIKWALDWEYAV